MTIGSKPGIWISVQVLRSTDKAHLVVYEGEEMWIPKSQIGANRADTDGVIERLEVSRWIAEQKGLLRG